MLHFVIPVRQQEKQLPSPLLEALKGRFLSTGETNPFFFSFEIAGGISGCFIAGRGLPSLVESEAKNHLAS